MFAHHNPHIMDIRGESVNMLALLRAVPKIHLGAVAYLEAYIDFVKPKLILSRNGDSDLNLWRLKRRKNTSYLVALVQNGWRPDKFGAMPISKYEKFGSVRPKIDIAFVFGLAQGDERVNDYSSEVVGSGSTKLNQIDLSELPYDEKEIVFISEYRHQEFLRNPDFYAIDSTVCRYVADFAIRNNLEVHIAGVMPDAERAAAEQEWFAGQFSGSKWFFHPRQESNSSYYLVNSAKLVVTVDSTMAYESLSMGQKTAILCCRKFKRTKGRETLFDLMLSKLERAGVDISKVDRVNNRFGASLSFPESGFFWSNIESQEEFERVLANVYEASEDEWKRVSRPFADQLMVHDYGNTKIRAYVEGVLTGSLKSN
jgi:surface carbohydrate biosynthesis protein